MAASSSGVITGPDHGGGASGANARGRRVGKGALKAV
jgi:hypothetical protein